MVGILCILVCWLLGNTISDLIGNYISGNVIGMLLMFAALKLRLFNPEVVRPAAKFLLAIMALCFVPFGVGLIESYTAIAENWVAILLSAAISTILVIISVGWVAQRLYKTK